MVMVFDNSDSSDSEQGRHDRFRSERVLLKTGPNNHVYRSNRQRSRSPTKEKYASHKRHHSDRREEERPSKRRSVDDYRASKERSRHSPILKKGNSENDRDRTSRESSKHTESKKSDHSRTVHEKDRSKGNFNCKKYRSDHDTHGRERDKSKKEHRRTSPLDDKKHSSERDKHSSDNERCVKTEDDRVKNDRDKSDNDKHKKTSNEQKKISPSETKSTMSENDEQRSCENKIDTRTSEEKNSRRVTPNHENHDKAKEEEKKLIGPMLPPHLQKLQAETTEEAEKKTEEEEEEECYGPVLPPGHRERVEEEAVQRIQPTSGGEEDGQSHDQEPGEEDIIGPELPGSTSSTQQILEQRASILKKQMENKDSSEAGETKKREEWMTQLPKNKGITGLGLEARKFRMREAPSGKDSDTSIWTDTPADKAKKSLTQQMGQDAALDTKEEHRLALMKERDQEMEKLAKKVKKDRKRDDKSLLEMHQKALKKKKKKEKKERDGKKEERRPFDRNIDLQANRLDEAQKKAIFKKAQFLDSRFSCGESKYL